ncbi:SGNH/GDSL hydrolase family protein [Planctomycetes bacterium K23_9]|uniref:SGNH hydrolase-type esterase domain-containing protein n=1 Tax=Stieleria marina TaxID=1930275 RepID=A0A517NRJ8_9BACT|nr:hypothetical protein K239x_16860 [Planctomycetes bacterium K23_9]
MHQILVYGDSLSWGVIPNTRNRLAFADRWPGVLERELLRQGHLARVIEDCLNGRRTALDDPSKPGRNGLVGLEQRIEVNSPLALVMLFLGTNDFQSMHDVNAVQSARGLGSLVAAIRRAPVEPGMPIPEIMLIAPPPIQIGKAAIAAKFLNAETKSVGLNTAIRDVAVAENCQFFDAGDVTATSEVDGVHLDRDQHSILGTALAVSVAAVLSLAQR